MGAVEHRSAVPITKRAADRAVMQIGGWRSVWRPQFRCLLAVRRHFGERWAVPHYPGDSRVLRGVPVDSTVQLNGLAALGA